MTMLTNALNARLLLLSTLALMACPVAATEPDNSPDIPFQGPVNASFESASGWSFSSTGNVGCLGGNPVSTNASIVTGTGFLPSAGIRYASLYSCNLGITGGPFPTAYQDGVYLNHSSSMSFDYSFSGILSGPATVEILFTSNGTAVLWTKTITGSGTVSLDKKTEVVSLPSTNTSGRLTIKLDARNVPSKLFFGIDNIRVN